MAGEGLSMKCFFTVNGGLFERPRAAFFTVAAAGVMPRMTVAMVGTMMRKTRFPTGVTTSATKAKPPADATAFCIFVVTLFNIRSCGICSWPADLSAAVTPSANRNSYRVAGRKPHPPRGRNTMSMDSCMNGHFFSLDDYASPISTLYLSATHSITPVTFGSALP